LEELHAARITTLRHIPGACRRTVAACIALLISDFVQWQSWEAIHRLQCFAKLVLRAPKRMGRAHAKKLALDVARRLRAFEAGQLSLLWSEATMAIQRDKPVRTRAAAKADEETLPKAVQETIRALVEEGALSKAAKHLVSTGLADSSDPAVLESLRRLHPTAAPIVVGDDVGLPGQVDPGIGNDEDGCDWGKLAWDAVVSFSRVRHLAQADCVLVTSRSASEQ
jgi:hypothetical protein